MVALNRAQSDNVGRARHELAQVLGAPLRGTCRTQLAPLQRDDLLDVLRDVLRWRRRGFGAA
jgi:hypothetical protein